MASSLAQTTGNEVKIGETSTLLAFKYRQNMRTYLKTGFHFSATNLVKPRFKFGVIGLSDRLDIPVAVRERCPHSRGG